ncbi:MAG: type II secretion system protein [Burkholderiales bacterium]|nr:type II secretion system protein [Burkholderiales bacterium]
MDTAAAKVFRSGAAACGKRALAGGFTYIGLLFLVAMVGVALTLVSEMWQTAQKREKEQELLFVGHQFRRALAMYRANGGGYPRELQDLIRDPRVPGVRRHLRKIYQDPITGGTEWGLLRTNGADGFITGVYSLSEAAPLKQTEFSLADADFEKKSKYSEWVFVAGPAQGSNSTPVDPTGNRTQSRVRR